MLSYGSVCSGIEAATVAWHPLGWRAAWLAEIEKFPSKVLAHHYPSVPNLGDMTRLPMLILGGMVEAPDVLVGGTPCQAFSVAGLRQSLEDDRGQLTLTYIHILDALDAVRAEPAIAVWENVPGVLNTPDNAFGCFLAGLAGEDVPLQPAGKRWTDAGYVSGPKRTVAWRVLDAQYFGVAQRRRRVFVVASARAGFDPAAVLFEFDGVRRDTAPSRETGQSITHPVAPSLTSSGRGVERSGETRGQDPVVCMAHGQAGAEIRSEGDPSLTCNHEAPIVAFHAEAQVDQMNFSGTHAASLTASQHAAVAFGLAGSMINRKEHNGPNGSGIYHNFCPTQTKCDIHAVATQMQVRRLTPTECERLQGFPDGYTNIPGAADGPRYKALGNSMAVPVMNWIGRRLQCVI